MQSMSRLALYQNMVNIGRYEDEKNLVLNVNIVVLSGIEQLFLTDDEQPENKENRDPAILQLLRENIESAQTQWGNDKEVRRLILKLRKIIEAYEGKKENEAQNSRNIFNKVINELGLFNGKYLPDGVVPIGGREKGDMPQVFLSHAYDDRLYAFSLFEYFYDQGIYLYVDWMHHGPSADGRDLKNYLNNEINNSIQLLFLRTLNSELDIQGKQMLRSWCAWELGNFYRKENEKYLINLYSVDKYGNANLQLHGLKIYTGVQADRLTGIEITP